MARINNIIFMGTADFAVPALRYLIDSGHAPRLVLSQPDRQAGRGRQPQPSPVKQLALQHQLPMLQPETFKQNSELRTAIEALRPDLIVVAAYGHIVPEWVLKLPKLGCLNLHGSLLPKYRGAAPIQWSIIRGETETGVTLMEMAPQMDAGNVIFAERLKIGADETYTELQSRLSNLNAGLLERYFKVVEGGKTPPSLPQDPTQVTMAPKITAEVSRIDWQRSASEVHNLIRGLNDKPLAFTNFRGQKIKIVRSLISTVTAATGEAGTIIKVEPRGLHVACGSGTLLVTELIPENRAKLEAGAFANGARIKTGERFAD